MFFGASDPAAGPPRTKKQEPGGGRRALAGFGRPARARADQSLVFRKEKSRKEEPSIGRSQATRQGQAKVSKEIRSRLPAVGARSCDAGSKSGEKPGSTAVARQPARPENSRTRRTGLSPIIGAPSSGPHDRAPQLGVGHHNRTRRSRALRVEFVGRHPDAEGAKFAKSEGSKPKTRSAHARGRQGEAKRNGQEELDTGEAGKKLDEAKDWLGGRRTERNLRGKPSWVVRSRTKGSKAKESQAGPGRGIASTTSPACARRVPSTIARLFPASCDASILSRPNGGRPRRRMA